MFPYNVSKLGDTSFLGLNLEFFSGQSTLLGWGSGFTYLFSPDSPVQFIVGLRSDRTQH